MSIASTLRYAAEAAILFSLMPMRAEEVRAVECVTPAVDVVTSEVAFQVFDENLQRLPGVSVKLDRRGQHVASGETDDGGHLAFSGVPAGRYQFLLELRGFQSVQQDVRVVSRDQAPPRLMNVMLRIGFHCPAWDMCVSPGGFGRLASVPKCLVKKSPERQLTR